jgi:hypothetical protein
MKQILFFVLANISILALGQTANIEIDTLVSRNGDLAEVAFYKDNLYLLFVTSRRNTTAWFKSMKVYDTTGNFIENVYLPKEALSMPYCDLRVNNQRLYMVQEESFEQNTFLLEKYVADFNKAANVHVNIYEDSNFCIYPNCHGEWGASMYFMRKHDNKVYEFQSTFQTFCNYNFTCIKDGYLLCNHHEILIIKDPAKLYESELTFNDDFLGKRNQGVDTLFKTNVNLYTAYAADNKLMVLYNDSSGTCLGELKSGELKSVYTFKERYRFFFWFGDNNSNSQILGMYTYKSINEWGAIEGYEMLGFLLINNGRLKQYFIK